jgi:hypothetical protein
VFWPFISYSALLLGILCAVVLGLTPPQTTEERQDIPHRHHTAQNIILAEKLISQRLPIPPSQWSYDFRCMEIGHGVWYAQGLVDIVSPLGQKVTLGWMTIFIPEAPHPLYLGVGLDEEGDYAAALRRAGIARIPRRNP